MSETSTPLQTPSVQTPMNNKKKKKKSRKKLLWILGLLLIAIIVIAVIISSKKETLITVQTEKIKPSRRIFPKSLFGILLIGDFTSGRI